jgi:5-amino-6-(5-phosphoribosylamino)uracil reductase/diaminohydroxyphosphoribosylaminopyrimidine deaminase/5-amino-6-(5-phosphoribosylamino)uracil reductase
VTVKIAQTLDGRIATRTGQSQWISGEAARAFAHELRACHDVVLVGIGTVLHDDPRLTVRLVPGPDPRRVVVDSRARIPLDCNLLLHGAELTTVFVGEAAPSERVARVRACGVRVLTARHDDRGRLDLADVLASLATDGVRSVMVEGGAGIITSLLAAGLVDRLVVSIAPKVLGAGLDAVGDLGITSLADALVFEHSEIRQLGPDIVFDGVLASNGRRSSPAVASNE